MAATLPIKTVLLALILLLLLFLNRQSRLLRSKYLDAFSSESVDNEVFYQPTVSELSQISSKSQDRSKEPSRKWAYAFLIGGCGSSSPEYRGFLYNAIVAAHRLKELGSRAEVVIMIQMSIRTNEIELPEVESRILEQMGIRVHYIEKVASTEHEVFYSLVQEKFRILSLTEYSRILFLDGDIMPICSLDYLFDLSEPHEGKATLKENLVLSWRKEAANAGFFMLAPNSDDYRHLLDVIQTKEKKALQLPWPHWDEVEGWGHIIQEPDFWRTEDGKRGTNWTWHAVFADQGLLYYWTKYVKKSVSLAIGHEVENWSSKNGQLVLEETLRKNPLKSFSCDHHEYKVLSRKPSPYHDFVHFTGRAKPWEQSNYLSYLKSTHPEIVGNRTTQPLPAATLLWFHSLEAVQNFTGTNFDFAFVLEDGEHKPPVGRFSDYGQMITHIKSKARRNWTHYQ